ncbi:MAG: hypothetical protein F6J90_25325 [Moorea sp. SIOASIH]|uniref:hypothetical protein n=1 Tax=Moorena sp. SIOASIH TaxID=2607817 RepID=UPI0013B6A779|nr:hypothetical protein [Moorena sp. SIOASIH]NEO39471.1 hypothetical protein [Moorena sp. SIOASIH]
MGNSSAVITITNYLFPDYRSFTEALPKDLGNRAPLDETLERVAFKMGRSRAKRLKLDN